MTEVLITGASGELGHGLLKYFAASGSHSVIALDLKPLDPALLPLCKRFYQADILDSKAINEIQQSHRFSAVFHLAALLSTGSEKNPILAQQLNVNGALALLALARNHTLQSQTPVKFLFPSTIAVYGMPTLKEKSSTKKVKEDSFLSPITMYGVNKLYVENLGRYFSSFYNLLATEAEPKVDFRAIRFPGILSADTVPTSGTSDYGPEMLHAAAQKRPYNCFVRQDSTIPFMTMPDAVRAMTMLGAADRSKLSRISYNICGFSISAEQIRSTVLNHFPSAELNFKVDEKRQRIVDSWPEDVDDTAAIKDWGWKADYDINKAFAEYLVPGVCARYNIKI